jgi:hypothetical protein
MQHSLSSLLGLSGTAIRGPLTTGKIALLKQKSLNALPKPTTTKTRTKPTACYGPMASVTRRTAAPVALEQTPASLEGRTPRGRASASLEGPTPLE